jgi:hypothetical protein
MSSQEICIGVNRFQSKAFFDFMQDLAEDADDAKRGVQD